MDLADLYASMTLWGMVEDERTALLQEQAQGDKGPLTGPEELFP